MIELSNVSKNLKTQSVLSNIKFKFEEGKTYLITGHNGCGKTMLLRAICGLITPSEGQIFMDKDYDFGVIIETPSFMGNETALYNLKYLASIKNKISIKEIEYAMAQLNLLQYKNKRVKRYSLGMRQRLGLCQAIMEDPDVLLLDEPFNAIDESNLEQIYELINSLRKKNKIIIIASHGQINHQKLIVDETIKMENGKIVY